MAKSTQALGASQTVAGRSASSRHWPTAIDLFSGCGAVTAGLRAAGFRIVAAVDNDPVACQSYRRNHPSVRLVERDITTIDPTELIKPYRLKGRMLDLMVVCAPCQPFSSHRRTVGVDTRTSLVLESIRFAEALTPRLILLENVAGLMGPRFAGLRSKLDAGLRELGYLLGGPKRLDAANFGVPQRRTRWILLAAKGSEPPELPERILKDRSPTVRNAIADLAPLKSGESDEYDALHFARHHRQITLNRLRHIPKDGEPRTLTWQPRRSLSNVGQTIWMGILVI